MRKIAISALGICLLLVILVFTALIMPIPPKRTVYEENSPDGAMTAIYSYRSTGLVGWMQDGDPSYVYLDVYQRKSGERVRHFVGGGDVPWEAVDRLHANLPWPAKRTTGNPLVK